MEQALLGDEYTVEHKLAGTLTKEQVEALQASQDILYGDGDGGAVKRALPRLARDHGPGKLSSPAAGLCSPLPGAGCATGGYRLARAAWTISSPFAP